MAVSETTVAVAHPTVASSGRRPLALLVAFVVACLAGLLAAVLWATDGHFTYTLDDPYIHLALAQQIADGHYGINPGEASSPSSSILWPVLMAALVPLPWGDVWPLVVNGVCLVATAVVLHGALRRSVSAGAAAVATGLVLVAMNGVGVVFTGLENSPQILLAVIVTAGVLALVDTPAVLPRSLVAAVVVGPLLRYELAAFSVAAAVVLFALGHRRAAALATGTWLALAASFSGFLVWSGLDPLPSSVLVKSDTGAGSLPAAMADQVSIALSQPGFVVCVVVVALNALLRRRWTVLHTFAGVVLVGHGLAGHFNGLGRYELYVYLGLLPLLVRLATQWRSRAALPALVAVLGLSALVGQTPLFFNTLATPSASRDIWSQQAQTAAFVRDEWRRPVAVNDLGLVAFRGGQPVLDLWGLASEDARVARLDGGDPGWMDAIVRRSGVRLVAIYADWFDGEIPTSWTLAGRITGASPVSSSHQTVDLYAPDPADADEICAELLDFRSRSESRWTRFECGPGQDG
ncbi:hypothetical protein G5V58_06830 [Nocardioides anomalus]|uniref:Glycosyltransferase family 39 protein n=1 Tax=Nocardioides anomalus TaxID=2712223 RepID=A0A6G6WBP5_9ACTN|nr:hypothetical protein [Nocardioides anomalus]QIG42525.1 hypothetical protein G5V58_06830 [Nocardioides anomalus]